MITLLAVLLINAFISVACSGGVYVAVNRKLNAHATEIKEHVSGHVASVKQHTADSLKPIHETISKTYTPPAAHWDHNTRKVIRSS